MVSALEVRSLFEEVVRTRLVGHADWMHGVLQLELSGEGALDCFIDVKPDKRSSVHDGKHPAARATVAAPAEVMMRLASGAPKDDVELEGLLSLLRINGDIFFLQALSHLFQPNDEELMRRLEEAEAIAAGMRVTHVERMAMPSQSEMWELIRARRPIVVTGALERWPPVGSTVADLRHQFGEVMLTKTVSMGQFVDAVEQGSPLQGLRGSNDPVIGLVSDAYIYGFEATEALRAVFPAPAFLETVDYTQQLWFGRGKHDEAEPTTPTHRDIFHTVLCQGWGQKRVVLCSPDQADALYPFRNFAAEYQPVWAKPWKPDFDHHPRLRELEPIDCTIGPGDALLIPCGWFHTVYVAGWTLSISFGLQPDASPRR